MAKMTPAKSPMLKSPMPKSPMPKSPMVCEKYETGCMWHLYGLFNFRQGRSNKKRLSHKRHTNRLDDGNFKTKLDLLNKMDENGQSMDDRMKNKTQTVDSDMASKRKLKGEDLSTEPQMNKKFATDEGEDIPSNSKFVGHLPKNYGKTSKTHQRSHEAKHQKHSNSVLVEEPLNKLNSAAVPELSSKEVHSKNRRGCGCKSIDTVKHDQLNEINLVPVQLNAAEAIINQKFIDGVNHQSKQLLDALEILNSNKELFRKLLQDPNSLLVKHIEDLRDSQARTHQGKSPCEANISEYRTSKARQSEGPSSIHTLKSCDIYPSQENGESEFPERIVVLKPGPPSMEISSESINTSLQSLRNNGQSDTPANSSFSRIKRKLRHAISESRKEQHSKSIDGTLNTPPCQSTGDNSKGKGMKIIRSNSPSVDGGGVTKSSLDIKKKENIGKVKQCESSIGREAASTSGSGLGNSNISLVSQPKREESETYVEAGKHLSELLNNGNKEKSYFERQAQKTWGRVMSFPEYDFLPICNPVRDWENGFLNEQMTFSPYSNCQMVYENKWRLHKEKKAGYSSPLRQDVEALPDNKKLDDQLQVFDTRPNNSDYPFADINVQGDISSLKGCVQIVENDNTMHQGETSSLEVPSESESADKFDTIKANNTIRPGETNYLEVLSKPDCTENTNTTETNDTSYQGETQHSEILTELDSTDKALDQSSETTNMYEEEEYFKRSRQPLTSSPDVFQSSPSSIQRVEDSDCIEDKGEQPSPVSVLEQFFVDATSYASTISEPAEEHHPALLVKSPLEPETSSLNDHEYISEYVMAVLQASGLNWDELSMMCQLSDRLLDPFLFDAVKLQPNQFHGDCMLLFDCINEVLVKVCHTHLPCSPWVSFIKPNARRKLCIEKTVIHEVMKSVHPSPHTMQQIVEKDIAQSGMRLDIRNDVEETVFEMVEDVLEGLIMETIF
ncbi:hypothetical protein CerSpe_180110 [Prunus speciosa]